MSPMALNVPIAMLMSMVVAFTITPGWPIMCSREPTGSQGKGKGDRSSTSDTTGQIHSSHQDLYDPEETQEESTLSIL